MILNEGESKSELENTPAIRRKATSIGSAKASRSTAVIFASPQVTRKAKRRERIKSQQNRIKTNSSNIDSLHFLGILSLVR